MFKIAWFFTSTEANLISVMPGNRALQRISNRAHFGSIPYRADAKAGTVFESDPAVEWSIDFILYMPLIMTLGFYRTLF
ncbi:hypothetical protein [Pseudomonas sp. Pseusp16]|uniref:hypothetical protein n=1 Tax=Pseudomonas sp. Pseusp16 TaxID=3243021 RepID=UPI0039B4F414